MIGVERVSFRDEMRVNEREKERHGVKEWKKKKEKEKKEQVYYFNHRQNK